MKFGMIDTIRFRLMRSGCLGITVVMLLFATGACWQAANPYIGESDAEINDAQAYADSLPVDHPDKAEAVANVAAMRANRKAAEDKVALVGALANHALPGAAVALSMLYGIMQKVRSGKDQKDKTLKDQALKVTMAVVDEVVERGSEIKPAEFIEKLKEAHNEGGVREVVRTTLEELHNKKV